MFAGEENREEKRAEFREQIEQDAVANQFRKMCRLKKEHFGIEGTTGWRPWYELALALAIELDEALTIVDPRTLPTSKTTPHWRGAWGRVFLEEIDALRNRAGGKVKLEAILAEHQQLSPRYREMPPDELRKNYFEAKRHHEKCTKRRAK